LAGSSSGKKFVAARLQTRLFAAPHKKEDRSHPQVNNTTKTLSGGPAGGAYSPFCEGLQTAWFAAGLQQIFFPSSGLWFLVSPRQIKPQLVAPFVISYPCLLCLSGEEKKTTFTCAAMVDGVGGLDAATSQAILKNTVYPILIQITIIYWIQI
jgi:hypothetical protein